MEKYFKSKENQMKIKKKKLLEGMKYRTKKTIIEEDEKLNKLNKNCKKQKKQKKTKTKTKN